MAEQSKGKSFLKSKTLWANLVGLGALYVQTKTGFVVPPEIQVAGLGMINTGLRMVTKEPIVWGED